MFLKTGHKNFDSDGMVSGDLYADPGSGLYLFYSRGFWNISETLGYPLDVDGVEFQTEFYTFNGRNLRSGGDLFLWYDNSGTASVYVISKGPGFGTDDSDSYWTSATLEGSYSPGGEATENKNVSVGTLKGWHQPDGEILGRYTPSGGESGYRYVGLRKFEDQNGKMYLQSSAKNGDYFSYGDIHHDGNGWVIGVRGSGAWWTGSEPDIDSGVTFYKQGEAAENLYINFDSFVANSEKEKGYLFEACVLL